MKIVSYNIHMGLETQALVKNICDFAARGVDVFCLQEFWKWMQPSDLETLLLEALGPQWQMEYETPVRPSHNFGQCIVWKNTELKNVSFQRLPLPLLPKAKAWEKAFIGLHGFSTFIVQRGASSGTFVWNNRRLRITNVHLDWQGGLRQRSAQLAYLRNYLNSCPEVDCEIICGDLNSLGIFNKTEQKKIIAGILGNGFYDACSIPDVTCPPFQCLDHIFVKNLRVLQFKTCRLNGSDHFPVIADLTI